MIPHIHPSSPHERLQQGDLAVHLQCAKQSKGFNIVDKLDSVNPIFIYVASRMLYAARVRTVFVLAAASKGPNPSGMKVLVF